MHFIHSCIMKIRLKNSKELELISVLNENSQSVSVLLQPHLNYLVYLAKMIIIIMYRLSDEIIGAKIKLNRFFS